MRNATVYLWSKKIHRYLVLVVVLLGIVMIASGYMMHEGSYFFFSPAAVRSVHNAISIVFSVTLGIMMLTGLYLFLFPYFPVKKDAPQPLNP